METEGGAPTAASRLPVMLFCAILVLTMLLAALSIPAGLYAVFFTTISPTKGPFTPAQAIGIFIGPVAVGIPIPGTFGEVFASFCILYAALLALAATQGRSLFSALGDSLRGTASSIFSNRLLVTLVSIGFITFTIMIFDSLETAAGVPIGGLSGDPLDLFVSLTVAPLREEFGFRMLLIGAVALVASVGSPLRSALGAFWRPSALFGGRPVDPLVKPALYAMLLLSSLAFGLAHVATNSGWAIGKLPEAAWAGLVLGYIYIRYGFHVAVLTHWGVDYLGTVYSFLGQGVSGISWVSGGGYALENLMALDLTWMLGLGSFLLVVYTSLTWYLGRNSMPSV